MSPLQQFHNSGTDGLRIIKFAFNATGTNKNWDFKKLAANFIDVEGTLADVQQHIKAGHAICAGLLGGKWRSKANIIGSHWLLLDIDNSKIARDEDGKPILDENGNSIKVYDPQLTIESALAHPFIKKHCALIYTTASHKHNWHKFRLIFILPQYVEGADTVEACTRFLMQQLPHDPACKDASRVFYGNTEAEFPLVNPEATLPAEWVTEAMAMAAPAEGISLHEREEYQQRLKEIESRRQQWREISNTEGWDIDQQILQALSFIPPRSPGSGNYDECRQVLMALVSHYGAAEAEIIAENWSPSIKGTTWNIRAKIRSFRRAGITIGTLFHIAKQYGFRFPKRQYQAFSPQLPNPQLPSPQLPNPQLPNPQLPNPQLPSPQLPNPQLPNPQLPNPQLHSPTITREQWELGRVREDLTSFQNLLKQAIAPFTTIFKGFKTPPSIPPLPEINAPDSAPLVIIYTPGNIPQKTEVTEDIRIQCQPEEHIAAWLEAVSKGWTHILDNSHPGLGKSYNAGQLTAAQFGIDKLIYQDANHRNPSTLPIEENFVDLPVRNNGFKLDPHRKTPLGNDFQLWTKPGETADTIGNCHRTYLFNAFRNKNFTSLDFEESDISPICNGCPLKDQCCFASGDGYGFRFQKRTTINQFSELRAHPDSTPTNLTKFQKRTTIEKEATEQGSLNRGEGTERDSTPPVAPAERRVRKPLNRNGRLRPIFRSAPRQKKRVISPRSLAPSKSLFVHQFSKLTAHPDSTPTDLTNDLTKAANQNLTVGRIWEEAGTLIKPVRCLNVSLTDFEKTVGQLALSAPSLLVQLQPVIQALHPLFTQDTESHGRYGFDDTSVRAMLPKFPSDLDIEAVRQALEPDLKFLEDLDTLDVNLDGQLKKSAAARYAAKKITKDSARNAGQEFLDLPLYWLPDFLEAWKGEGSFTSSYGVLSIYRKNPKHVDLVNSAQFNIFLDATLTTSGLKLKLGSSDPVLVIEQQRPDYGNLSVINVTGLGKLPKYRSPFLIARVNALKEALTKLHSQIGIIDWKAIADTATDRREYGHFVDGRGVNRFSDATAIASFGIPYQNIGVLAAEYQVMTGEPVTLGDDDSNFQKYLTSLVQAEIFQELGRLRSHRRPTEELSFYFCADYDLSFLADQLPNVKLQSIDAVQLCPEAGDKEQQRGISIVKAFTQLWESKQKIGQTEIAEIIGVTQEWVSRFTKRWGGWFKFRKLLLLLLDSLYSDSNKNLPELTDDEMWFASEYFPMLCQQPLSPLEEKLDDVVQVVTTIGNRAMQRVLDFCTPQVRANLLIIVLSCLPTEVYLNECILRVVAPVPILLG